MQASGEKSARHLTRIPALQGCASPPSPFQEKVPVWGCQAVWLWGRSRGEGSTKRVARAASSRQ